MSKLKSMRKFLGLSQKEVAAKAGVSPATLNVMESKGVFSTPTARKYAAAMGCNPVFLLEGLDIVDLPKKF